MRSLAFTGALALLSAAQTPALAQGARAETAADACPSGRLSIYYARGDATPTEQAKVLMARIGQEALACQADSVDLVTEIDTTADGEASRAVALALARLNSVADALIAEGVPADRIRVQAQAVPDVVRPPMREVGVMFRKAEMEAGDASTPKPRPRLQPQRDAI